MKKGLIYNFYPVEIDEYGEIYSCEDIWQWKYLGWWFEMYTYMRAIIADLMGIEDLQFIIKMKDK